MTATHVVTGVIGLISAYDALSSPPNKYTLKEVISKIIDFALPILCVFGAGLLANRILPPTTALRMAGGVGIQLGAGFVFTMIGIFVQVNTGL